MPADLACAFCPSELAKGNGLMKKKLLDSFVASIREAGRIRRGEAKPSRKFEFAATHMKAVRQRTARDSKRQNPP
jgi:hypothetical protein